MKMVQSYSQRLFYEAVEKITNLYRQGMHPALIAANVNLSDSIVNAIIERHILNDKE